MRKFDIPLYCLLLLMCFTLHAQKSAAPQNDIPLVDPVTHCELRYYYFPNIEAFFDTKKSVYIYKDNDQWITATEIPSGYRGYSLYNKASVFINDYDGDEPIQFLKLYKKKYPYNLRGKYREMTASLTD